MRKKKKEEGGRRKIKAALPQVLSVTISVNLLEKLLVELLSTARAYFFFPILLCNLNEGVYVISHGAPKALVRLSIFKQSFHKKHVQSFNEDAKMKKEMCL